MNANLNTNLLFCFFNSNHKFVELYTEDLVGNTGKQIQQKMWALYRVGSGAFWHILRAENARCLEAFEEKAYSGYLVLENLERFLVFNQHPIEEDANFRPTITEAVEILEEMMDGLKNSSDDQIFAFGLDSAWGVYWDQAVHSVHF